MTTPAIDLHALSPEEREAWVTAEDDKRPDEDREQTQALRRYLVDRILTRSDSAVSFSQLIADVDPDGRWWSRDRGRPIGAGRPAIGQALFYLTRAENDAGRPLLPALVGYKQGDTVGPPSDHFVNVATAWCGFEIPPGTGAAYIRNEVRRVRRYWLAQFGMGY